MIITGGRGKNIQEILPTEVYDTEQSECKKFNGLGLYRQSCFMRDTSLYIYGGFENSNSNIPVDTLKRVDIISYFENCQWIHTKIEEMGHKKSGKEKENLFANNLNTTHNPLTKNSLVDNNLKKDQKFKLSHQAVVGKLSGEDSFTDDTSIFRKVSIDKLVQETKRIGQENVRCLVQTKRIYNEELIDKFIDTLLRPFDWHSQEVEELLNNLPFTYDEIVFLIQESAVLIAKDHSLIRLRSPCKIFGNLYGQYNDLMRFFESFGHPSDENQMGDIHVMQYIFLGDFCDRGNHSLELILLLLALKVNQH